MLIEVRKAVSCNILLDVLTTKFTAMTADGFRHICNRDDDRAKQMLLVSEFVQRQLNPMRAAFFAWKAHSDAPELLEKTERLVGLFTVIYNPLRWAWNRLGTWDPILGRRILRILIGNLKRSPRGMLALWKS
ncbi:MAG: hypothetical protein V2I33_20520 [Kangiellaceae bacterium]|jgi:hypothetical protein|nr:hypothetical protein [Kangiellaceae bacterium]